MDIGLHVKYLLFLSDFVDTNFFDRFSKKYCDVKFREKCVQWKPSRSLRTNRGTDMTKLIIAL